MNTRSSVVLGAPVLALIFSVAPAASAHSFPEQETPSAGAMLTEPPAQVTIKYDAPIEKLFASLQVVSAMGQNQVTGKPEVSADGRKLSVPVNKLPPGEYTVQWRVVCIDSHHTQGSYSFIVAGPPL
jgi:methionine-rich copper-binding protein CopC